MKTLFKVLLLILLAMILVVHAFNVFSPRKNHIPVCPVNAIMMENGKAVIDSSKCIGCRRCVDGFPFIPVQQDQDNKTLSDPIPDAPAVNEIPESPVRKSPTKKENTSVTPNAVDQAGKKAYSIDSSTCIGCGLCIKVCPVNAIQMQDDKAVIDKEMCINCGICKNGNDTDYAGCPVSAISSP